MVLKNTSIWGNGRSSTNNHVVPPPKPTQPQPATGVVGTHTSYETDPSGNRMEVTYDATGKIVGSRKVGRGEGSEYAAGTSGGVPMNASNWQKLIALLQSKFGISL